MKSPELIATEIVNQFAWTSNVTHKGMLVSQQVVVAEAIAESIETDRAEAAAEIARLRARPTEDEVEDAVAIELFKDGTALDVARAVLALFPKVRP